MQNEKASSFRRMIRAVASTVLPETSNLDDTGWRELDRIVEQSVGTRPPPLRRRLRLFLRLIGWAALIRYQMPFHALSLKRRERVLRYFENNPLSLLRVGFWGVRTLVMMGFYGQPTVQNEIGYRPDPRGWDGME
jgi:hypothetical protein